MTVKRKADSTPSKSPPPKKRNTKDTQAAFRDDLFQPETLKSFRDSYAKSGPYPHAVVSNLIQESLLRDVRSEITENIHFTLKETDIYRIHQSGDLANLSNLDQESLKRLPSLVKLRDALYSGEFREWVSEVTGAGKVSGRKTDMAVNVYTPGSYLLCHDDVIGSRRVSYILYLTDPDNPWKPEWGGGLRLYPTEPRKNLADKDVRVPLAEWNVNIPPSFSQLSFFAVRPGESYHDVEEVFHARDTEEDKGRVRMAVSGWFHIPQEGEDGYEEGVEQAQAQKSSLAQLQGAADEFDEPQEKFRHFDEPRKVANAQADGHEEDPGEEDDEDQSILTEQDLTFLLKYIAPGFLVPDKLEELAESFEATSMLQLEAFLSEKFTKELKPSIETAESHKEPVQYSGWPIARPPHKQRFAYMNDTPDHSESTPISLLLVDLLHSHAFKKWLALATGLKSSGLTRQYTVARRFRAGHDYALASTYTGEQPRLEFTINMTPSKGWEREDTILPAHQNGKSTHHASSPKDATNELVTIDLPEYGGEEIYMAVDEADDHNKTLPSVGKKAAHDPAVYQSGNPDADDDGGILFSNAPSWNTFSVVLRDKNTMRFVKYVSQAAQGDRWDIKGEVELVEDAFDEDDEQNVLQLDEDDIEEEIEFSDDEGGDEDEDDDDDNDA